MYIQVCMEIKTGSSKSAPKANYTLHQHIHKVLQFWVITSQFKDKDFSGFYSNSIDFKTPTTLKRWKNAE